MFLQIEAGERIEAGEFVYIKDGKAYRSKLTGYEPGIDPSGVEAVVRPIRWAHDGMLVIDRHCDQCGAKFRTPHLAISEPSPFDGEQFVNVPHIVDAESKQRQ